MSHQKEKTAKQLRNDLLDLIDEFQRPKAALILDILLTMAKTAETDRTTKMMQTMFRKESDERT